ncbi:MAG TPA: glycine zipper 2TM domain-containing protein [Gammaproteobacteria bacterium]
MNKSMLMGLVAGIGVATAGGVAGYQFLGARNADTAVEAEDAAATSAAPAPTAAAPATRAAAAPAEECWDEEVTDTAAPKDEHRVAGTAIGAVVGGAIGKELGDGDSDLATAAGAAAGAFIGRKAQGEFQQNREGTRTTTHIERRCGPVGSAPR